MNSSCSIGTFDQGPSYIPWTICESNLSFQTTVSCFLRTMLELNGAKVMQIRWNCKNGHFRSLNDCALDSLILLFQETEVSTVDTSNSFYPDLLATDSTSKENDQPLATIEEYGNTFISLISNVIPTQTFCANGLNVMITPLNERKKLHNKRAPIKAAGTIQITT